MKVLFSALHLGYLRNFESVVRELAARGHQVHLTGDEHDVMGGHDLAERLSRECAGVTWGLLPSLATEEKWFDAARKLRLGLDYVRTLQPRYAVFPKLRARSVERTPRLVRWAAAVAPRATLSALQRVERLMPASDVFLRYLRTQTPDVVVLASLTYSRSQQMDLLKAARATRTPVAAAIMSWDHLSSKALIHIHPDLVLVWNDVQKHEAVDMHGVPAERVAATGAQCYDQWFTRRPDRSREQFCRDMGLRPDRRFVLWVHSAMSPRPDPPEPMLVARWIEALRASDDPVLRHLGVLVRPHPERVKEWAGVDLSRFENVVFAGRNPIDPAAKSDYFDALYHSSAVLGLVTSAFLEAVIVGRPVLTLTLPEYQIHQDGMLHFQYLRTVAGGVLQTAPDFATQLAQLSEAVGRTGRDERNTSFLRAFVRPDGLDTPATPVFTDALERLSRTGSAANPSMERQPRLAQTLLIAAATRTDGLVGRFLLNDTREDEWDSQREQKQRLRSAKQSAKAARMRAKNLRRFRRRVWDGSLLVAKETLSAGRAVRYRVAMLVHRMLALIGVDRGGVPGPEEK